VDLAPNADIPAARRILVRFLGDAVERARAEGVVLGVSGGVDSAVVLGLAVEALGCARVAAFAMPHATSDPTDEAHARLVAERFGVGLARAEVTPITDAVEAALPDTPFDARSRGNAKSRARMILLYAHANATNRLVLGTGNKSELLTGYFTKYGDGAADLYPLGDLLKTEVFALARLLGVPEPVVAKPPSAGLAPGQTDESDLGIAYADLDRVLVGLEAGHDAATIARVARLSPALVERVVRRMRDSEHKRSSLVVPKLSFRTPGLDWRQPREGAAAEGTR